MWMAYNNKGRYDEEGKGGWWLVTGGRWGGFQVKYKLTIAGKKNN